MAHSMDVSIRFVSNYAQVFGSINKGLTGIKKKEDKLKDFKPLGNMNSALKPLENINKNIDDYMTKQREAEEEAKKFKLGDFGGKVGNPIIAFFKGTIDEASKYKKAMEDAKKAGKSTGEINKLKVSKDAIKNIETFSKKMSKFNDSVSKAKIIIASDVMPILDKVLDKGTQLVNWFNSLDPAIQGTIVKVGLGTAVLGKSTQMFLTAKGKVKGFFGMLKKAKEAKGASKTVEEVAEGVKKSTGSMNKSQKALCGKSKRTSRSVKNSFKELKAGVGQMLSKTKAHLKSFLSKMKGFGRSAGNIIKNGVSLIGKNFRKLLNRAKELGRGMISIFTRVTAFMIANPIIAVIAAIIAVVILLYAAWKTNFGGIREKTKAVIDFIKERVAGIKQVFSNVVKGVKSFAGTIMKIWGKIKKFLQNPIKGTMNIASNIFGKLTGHNALGTSYWHGGSTLVGEHGPEVVDLPSGSRVHDARASQKLGGTISIAKLADKIIVREDADIDRITDALVRKLKTAGCNAV
ncbi:hypothetical protein [Clostridium oryzae]|uniref:Uncharacterized protein n=1 Tax=Clostridium oryzae TaxID=1450648 RepID=A0A1V4IFY2_9CLOT|nr:hypothetical protein [Clostridium oryzae]OPJ58437.1 hypothetical protein CLORY_35870 [Clostridium oryzae]